MKASTPTGRCGPCCSMAATGNTAMTRDMSKAWKSFQPISAHILVGNIACLPGSTLSRRHSLDLDLEFGPGKALHDHQGGGRRRVADKFIANLHIAGQAIGADHIGVESNEIGKSHVGLGEDGGDRRKAEPRLIFDAGRNYAVQADAELTRAKDEPRARGRLDAMDIARKGRVNAGRRQTAH